jgi:lipopolysaccharide/colanic/teichoic acid biosynthesis glycosyltransferase
MSITQSKLSRSVQCSPLDVAADRFRDVAKRLVDLLLSAFLLLLSIPLFFLVGTMVRLDSLGPVFDRQLRSGLHGRPFIMFKFRSMFVAAEADGRPVWAQRNDCRITRVGRILRSTRLDELPQLINVIRGEMSLVGPRPERPHFVEQLAQVFPQYVERSRVRPGITGWAQVHLPYAPAVEDAGEKLINDLYYVTNWSLWLDLRILAATFR